MRRPGFPIVAHTPSQPVAAFLENPAVPLAEFVNQERHFLTQYEKNNLHLIRMSASTSNVGRSIGWWLTFFAMVPQGILGGLLINLAFIDKSGVVWRVARVTTVGLVTVASEEGKRRLVGFFNGDFWDNITNFTFASYIPKSLTGVLNVGLSASISAFFAGLIIIAVYGTAGAPGIISILQQFDYAAARWLEYLIGNNATIDFFMICAFVSNMVGWPGIHRGFWEDVKNFGYWLMMQPSADRPRLAKAVWHMENNIYEILTQARNRLDSLQYKRAFTHDPLGDLVSILEKKPGARFIATLPAHANDFEKMFYILGYARQELVTKILEDAQRQAYEVQITLNCSKEYLTRWKSSSKRGDVLFVYDIKLSGLGDAIRTLVEKSYKHGWIAIRKNSRNKFERIVLTNDSPFVAFFQAIIDSNNPHNYDENAVRAEIEKGTLFKNRLLREDGSLRMSEENWQMIKSILPSNKLHAWRKATNNKAPKIKKLSDGTWRISGKVQAEIFSAAESLKRAVAQDLRLALIESSVNSQAIPKLPSWPSWLLTKSAAVTATVFGAYSVSNFAFLTDLIFEGIGYPQLSAFFRYPIQFSIWALVTRTVFPSVHDLMEYWAGRKNYVNPFTNKQDMWMKFVTTLMVVVGGFPNGYQAYAVNMGVLAIVAALIGPAFIEFAGFLTYTRAGAERNILLQSSTAKTSDNKIEVIDEAAWVKQFIIMLNRALGSLPNVDALSHPELNALVHESEKAPAATPNRFLSPAQQRLASAKDDNAIPEFKAAPAAQQGNAYQPLQFKRHWSSYPGQIYGLFMRHCCPGSRISSKHRDEAANSMAMGKYPEATVALAIRK